MFILEKLLDVIAPESCLVCQREGSILCSWCAPDACLPLPSRCVACQAQTTNFATCPKCRPKTQLTRVWVATEYTATAKELVKALKFGYKRSAAEPIAKYMHRACEFVPKETIIMPIPTASLRVRQRGFDHAFLIAKHFARANNHSVNTSLKRLGQSRQVGSTRSDRLQQLKGAFVVTKPQEIRGKSVILIDDVFTTGATLKTASMTLKQAGAKSVSAIVFAQTK